MRIVFFTHRFHPDVGGVQLSVEATARAFVAAGHEVHIVTETPGGETHEGLIVHRLLVPRMRPVTRLLRWRVLARLLPLFRASDVLHFHDYGTFVDWFLPLRPLCSGPVYAMTFHGFDAWPLQVRHLVQRDIAARMMDVTFAVGRYVGLLHPHRVDRVFAGAPLRSTFPPVPTQLHVLFVGRLADDTGLAPVLDALARASRVRGVTTPVTLVGEASPGWSVERRQWHGLALRHHPPTRDIDPQLAEASVLIATGFLALFDAFASGRCVIVPALTDIKRAYVASLDGIDEMALVARSHDELGRIAQHVVDGGWRREEDRSACARTFAAAHTWGAIANLHAEAYAAARTRRAA